MKSISRHHCLGSVWYKAGHASEDEAWTAAIRAKSGRANGGRVAPAKRLVSEFFTEWLHAIRDSVKPSTYTNYTDYRDAYVLPHIGNRKLQDVTVPMLNSTGTCSAKADGSATPTR